MALPAGYKTVSNNLKADGNGRLLLADGTGTKPTGSVPIPGELWADSDGRLLVNGGATTVINIKDPAFGGAVDGVTDDTAAWAAAITAAGSGGTIFTPSGTSIVTPATDGGVSIPDGIKIIGDGPSSVIQSKSGAYVGLAIFGVANGATAEFENLTIRGPATFTGSTQSVTGIYSAGNQTPAEVRCSGVRFERLAYGWRGKVGLLRVEGCTFDGKSIGATQDSCTGIHIPDDSGNALLICRGSVFKNLGSTLNNLCHAIYTYNSVSYLVDECDFQECTGGGLLLPHNGVTNANAVGSASNCRFKTTVLYHASRPILGGRTVYTNCHFDAPFCIGVQGDFQIDNSTFTNTSGGTGNAIEDNISGTGQPAFKATLSGCQFDGAATGSYSLYLTNPDRDVTVDGVRFNSSPSAAYIRNDVASTRGILRVVGGTAFKGSAAAIQTLGATVLEVTDSDFQNTGLAINIPTGSAAPTRIGLIGNNFSQSGTPTLKVDGTAPTALYTAKNYGSGVETDQGAAIASAATLTIPAFGEYFTVSGSTTITAISSTNMWKGRRFALAMLSNAGMTNNASQYLSGDFDPGGTQGVINLVWDGSGHVYEAGRASASVAVVPAGKGLKVKEGSNAKQGTATLVAGTVVVSNTSVTASSRIFLSRSTTGGTLGHLSYTLSAGTSFTINSSSGTDTSTINYEIFEPA